MHKYLKSLDLAGLKIEKLTTIAQQMNNEYITVEMLKNMERKDIINTFHNLKIPMGIAIAVHAAIHEEDSSSSESDGESGSGSDSSEEDPPEPPKEDFKYKISPLRDRKKIKHSVQKSAPVHESQGDLMGQIKNFDRSTKLKKSHAQNNRRRNRKRTFSIARSHQRKMSIMSLLRGSILSRKASMGGEDSDDEKTDGHGESWVEEVGDKKEPIEKGETETVKKIEPQKKKKNDSLGLWKRSQSETPMLKDLSLDSPEKTPKKSQKSISRTPKTPKNKKTRPKSVRFSPKIVKSIKEEKKKQRERSINSIMLEGEIAKMRSFILEEENKIRELQLQRVKEQRNMTEQEEEFEKEKKEELDRIKKLEEEREKKEKQLEKSKEEEAKRIMALMKIKEKGSKFICTYEGEELNLYLEETQIRIGKNKRVIVFAQIDSLEQVAKKTEMVYTLNLVDDEKVTLTIPKVIATQLMEELRIKLEDESDDESEYEGETDSDSEDEEEENIFDGTVNGKDVSLFVYEQGIFVESMKMWQFQYIESFCKSPKIKNEKVKFEFVFGEEKVVVEIPNDKAKEFEDLIIEEISEKPENKNEKENFDVTIQGMDYVVTLNDDHLLCNTAIVPYDDITTFTRLNKDGGVLFEMGVENGFLKIKIDEAPRADKFQKLFIEKMQQTEM